MAGCPLAARRRADRDYLATCDQHPEPGSGAPAARLAGCGRPASPSGADPGDPAAAKSLTNAAAQLLERPLKEQPPMLTRSLPQSLATLLAAFTPCFTQPTMRTFQALVAGCLAQPGQRTVTGMLVGAGLAGRCHHDLAYRFFATARWSADQLGLVLLDLICTTLLPSGAPVVLATDDTLWRRSGQSCTARPGTTTATAPAVTGPPGATAGWWSASSSTCRSSPGRCACPSWPGCGSPATPTAPRCCWPASCSTWSWTISATAPSTWSATPPTSANRSKGCPS